MSKSGLRPTIKPHGTTCLNGALRAPKLAGAAVRHESSYSPPRVGIADQAPCSTVLGGARLEVPARYQILFGRSIDPERTDFRTSSKVAMPPGAEAPHSNRVSPGVHWNSATFHVCAEPPRS
jgi:hypothetical protein